MRLELIVRSKRDADAVKAMLERFYPEWDIEVRTLKGARRVDDALQALGDGAGFRIIMLGREDSGLARDLSSRVPPTTVVHVVPRARVRNARLEHLAQELARARARFRASVWWSGDSYVFSPRGCNGCKPILSLERVEPSYEVFIGLGRTAELLSKLIGRDVPRNPLLVRREANIHEVYSGDRLVARLRFRDEGLRPEVLEVDGVGGFEARLERLIEANKAVIDAFERASARFLEALGDFDTVIVPWSGGKDSTAALLLALKVYGPRRVTAVFTDTGTEFPDTVEYVHKVARRLGVRLYVAYAGVDKALLEEGKPLPSHDNRWCTGLKIAATEKAILELADGRTLVVLGDRDAESPRRASRPTIRKVGDIVFAAPLRLWSAAHVQLYLLYKGIKLNPLYELGFYRVGCYMCPSLRSWELYVITSTRLYYRLVGSKIFRLFMLKRLAKRPSVAAGLGGAMVRSVLGLTMCCDTCAASTCALGAEKET